MNWGATSRAARDAAYNNPAAVPESASWMAMILGFGLIGGSLRGRRNAEAAISTRRD